MIAQQIQTTATSNAKSQAQQAQQQGQQQAQNVAAGFQSMLSMTDSSLTDLAQKTGAGATTTPQPANANKKSNSTDPTATPYVQAPNQPAQQPSQTQPAAGNQAAGSATGATNPALTPSTDAAAVAAAAAATDQNGTANNGNANSSAFGADALNARIVAGAPIYASQPTAAMATMPAHLLDAANAHPLPDEVVGKPGDATTAPAGKSSTGANDAMAPSTAGATAPTATLLPAHQAVTAVGGNNDKSDDDDASPSTQSADAATTATTNDPSTPSASMLAQPSTPQNTPLQVDAAVHTAAPYVPVGEQVAINLKQALNADNNQISIQLKPASLGTIDVKLNVGQDGRINAVITADRSDTLNMLKQDSGTLQQALKDAGLNADSNSLSFNLNSNAQSFAQNSSQGGSGSNGGGNGSPYASANASDALTGNDTATPVQRSHSGALNIEV